MKRYLEEWIKSDALAFGKMAFVSGPRQVGKSTLAAELVPDVKNRFNWDDNQFKLKWAKSPSGSIETRTQNLILLDEIHKDRLWKSKLKGIYDTQKSHLKIVVTGSARLDIFRKGGDSLLGRYFPYRLHPFSVGENESPISPEKCFENVVNSNFNVKNKFPVDELILLSGFPEPLLQGDLGRAKRWSKLRLERLIHEDLHDIRNVSDLQSIKLLVQLLPSKIGSPLSINSLRENINVAYGTIRDWITALEMLYVHFAVQPYSKKLSRMLVQESKVYLFDGTQIGERGLRLENLTALHLYKSCHFWTDTAQGNFNLHYLRNKEKQEVDFCVVNDEKICMLVECKSSDTEISKSLLKYSKELQCEINIQLVDIVGYNRYYPAHNVRVFGYDLFLGALV